MDDDENARTDIRGRPGRGQPRSAATAGRVPAQSPYAPGKPRRQEPFAKRARRGGRRGGERPKRDFKAMRPGKPGGVERAAGRVKVWQARSRAGAKPYRQARGRRGTQPAANARSAASLKRDRRVGDKPFRKPERDGGDRPRARDEPHESEREPGRRAARQPFGARPDGDRPSSAKPLRRASPSAARRPGRGPSAAKPSGPTAFSTRSIRRRRRSLSEEESEEADGERIAKRLARAGIASRRDAES